MKFAEEIAIIELLEAYTFTIKMQNSAVTLKYVKLKRDLSDEVVLEYYRLQKIAATDIPLDRMEQNREIFERMFDDREFGDIVKDWMLQKVFNTFNKSAI